MCVNEEQGICATAYTIQCYREIEQYLNPRAWNFKKVSITEVKHYNIYVSQGFKATVIMYHVTKILINIHKVFAFIVALILLKVILVSLLSITWKTKKNFVVWAGTHFYCHA